MAKRFDASRRTIVKSAAAAALVPAMPRSAFSVEPIRIGMPAALTGPVAGAAFFMLVEHVLSAYTDAWALFFGLIFIGFVMFAPEGIWGILTSRLPARSRA